VSVDRCHICEKLLDDSAPWQRGLDGGGAHLECLDTVEIDDEEGRDGEG
jgi:hypothetical protein